MEKGSVEVADEGKETVEGETEEEEEGRNEEVEEGVRDRFESQVLESTRDTRPAVPGRRREREDGTGGGDVVGDAVKGKTPQEKESSKGRIVHQVAELNNESHDGCHVLPGIGNIRRVALLDKPEAVSREKERETQERDEEELDGTGPRVENNDLVKGQAVAQLGRESAVRVAGQNGAVEREAEEEEEREDEEDLQEEERKMEEDDQVDGKLVERVVLLFGLVLVVGHP